MKKWLALLLSLCVVLTLAAKEYESRQAVDPNGYTYTYVTDDPYNAREYTLKNGMKVYLSRIPVKPRISFKAAVRGGMADSPADVTGLAHYFEHMMFKGTGKIGALDYAKEKPLLDRIEALFEEHRRTEDPKKKAEIYAEIDKLSSEAAKYASAGEYSKLVSSIGGMGLNAFTASDMTVYVVDIPAQELEKLLKLESERLRDPRRSRSDRAESDDPERQSGKLAGLPERKGEIRAAAPRAVRDGLRVFPHTVHQFQNQRENKLRHGVCAVCGHIADQNPAFARGDKVDDIVAGRLNRDEFEFRKLFHDLS